MIKKINFPIKDWYWLDESGYKYSPDSITIPSGLYFIWSMQDYLQEQYDIGTIDGQIGLIAWWQLNGRLHNKGLKIDIKLDDRLFDQYKSISQCELYPVSKFVAASAKLNVEFWQSLDLRSSGDQKKLLYWYYSHVVKGNRPLEKNELDFLSSKAPLIEQDTQLPITKAMMIGINGRPDLHSLFNLESHEGRLAYEGWWIAGGYKDLVLGELGTEQLDALLSAATSIEQDTQLPITKVMVIGINGRPDLQSLFNLESREGRLAYESWWVAGGYNGLMPGGLDTEQYDALLSDAIGIEQDTQLPITKAMMIGINGRPDLQSSFNLESHEGRLAYEYWWISGGYKDLVPGELGTEQIDNLLSTATNIEQDTHLPITNAMLILWQQRSDLQHVYDLKSMASRLAFNEWWDEHGIQNLTLWGIASIYNERIQVDDAAVRYFDGYDPDGINLIGLVKGELGLGEDVRMAATAMTAAQVNCSMFNFPANTHSRQQDNRFSHLLREGLIYNVNMVNLTGFEHASLLMTHGRKVFDSRYTIGAWPWELSAWPSQCRSVYNIVDEIWASSRYTAKSYSDAPVPVIYMPMAVDFDLHSKYSRGDFQLDDKPYLFLYVFDGLSYMARKNPIAHIKAFWKAFPKSNKRVGLVVKTMNSNFDNMIWRKFHKMAASDDRITVISETYSKNRVLGLMNCCDAFLSLHRAEGFGRCIAEMMLLGKPVIVTGFSGNCDFTTTETAFMVDGELVPVKKGEYPYGSGQLWCDPDIGLAAEHMKHCFEQTSTVNIIAQAGKARIQRDYSVETVAKKYRERLMILGLLK